MNKIKKSALIKLGSLIVAAVFSLSAFAISEKNEAAIKERTAPMAQVCLQGDDSCGAPVVAAPTGPMSAEDVYNGSCAACHGTGVAGAPKFGDAGAWAPRIALGMDSMYGNAINGVNAMPPKGLCMSCSDEELQAAVDYMVENSQ